MAISQQESDALNIIRWSSTIAIVFCHFLQGYDSLWAWVFNLGVQIFFFLSGFLYGDKHVSSITQFYWGRFKKVYIPYVIWVIVAFIILCLFTTDAPTISVLFKKLLFHGYIHGLNHLWFMYVIMLCYLILPFVDRLLSKNAMFGITILAIASGTLLAYRYTSTYLWITLYFVGYLCGRYVILQRSVFLIAGCISLWLMTSYGFNLEFWRTDSWQNNLLHAATGTVIFLGLYFALSQLRLSRHIASTFAKSGSYEVYLTHHIFILGPLSLLWLTPSRFLNCVIILIIIFVCTFVLMRASAITKRLP